ncbi:alpha/beta hydrolase [Rhodoblastus sp.]|uniref:alpha/beta hydrolase n=1 Tax=Rhodoblastus sp. TaxID=1962975 RepID=UPI003F9B6023
MSRATRIFLSILALCIGFGLLASWRVGTEMIWRRKEATIAAAVAPASDLTISTPDGMTLGATYWPGKNPNSPGVLLLHGLGESRQAFAANADWLAKQGYAVLTIDFRGHGQSSDAPHSFGLEESMDAQTAFDWLKKSQRGAPVGVIGISLGGAAALLGKNGPVPADALVLQAVFPDIRRAIRNRIAAHLPAPLAYALEPLLSYQSPMRFGVWPDRITPVEALKSYKGPVLIVGGANDSFTPPSESREMFAAATEHKEFLLLRGLNHFQAAAAKSDQYRGEILKFFASTLGAP